MTTIDLSKYILSRSDNSRCPDCGKHVFLLTPRTGTARAIFFLCLCGAIRQAGRAKIIAAPEHPRTLAH